MVWPVLADVATGFRTGPFARPQKLFNEFFAKGAGSGRRAGPRDLLWQTVAVSSLAALEAGLEELLLGAHAARLGCQGAVATPGVNSPDTNPRKWLSDDRLMAPSAVKIERILFADFGIVLSSLPTQAHFEVRRKQSSLGGSGQGSPAAGPREWPRLKAYLETLSHVRNAAAHGDASKLGASPSRCEGDLWLTKQNGSWSIQQPHALTALRTVVSAFNLAAVELANATGESVPSMMLPDEVGYPA